MYIQYQMKNISYDYYSEYTLFREKQIKIYLELSDKMIQQKIK